MKTNNRSRDKYEISEVNIDPMIIEKIRLNNNIRQQIIANQKRIVLQMKNETNSIYQNAQEQQLKRI